MSTKCGRSSKNTCGSWDSTKREVDCIAENGLAAESKHRHNRKEVGTGLGRFGGGEKKSAGQKTKTIREFRSKDSKTMVISSNFIVMGESVPRRNPNHGGIGQEKDFKVTPSDRQ